MLIAITTWLPVNWLEHIFHYFKIYYDVTINLLDKPQSELVESSRSFHGCAMHFVAKYFATEVLGPIDWAMSQIGCTLLNL